jgi:hypothetical protein
MLCEAYRNIFNGGRVFHKEGQSYPKHHSDFQSFRRSIEQKCYICIKAWNSFTENHENYLYCLPGDFMDTWYTLSEDVTAGLPERSYQLTIFLSAKNESTWYNLDVRAKRFVISAGETLIHDVNYLQDFAHLVESRAIEASTNSKSCQTLALQSLLTCTQTHTRCKSPSKMINFLPTRLIDVGAGAPRSKLRLVDTQAFSRKEIYMTLSHCWGTESVTKLTNSSRRILVRCKIHANPWQPAIAEPRPTKKQPKCRFSKLACQRRHFIVDCKLLKV